MESKSWRAFYVGGVLGSGALFRDFYDKQQAVEFSEPTFKGGEYDEVFIVEYPTAVIVKRWAR